MLTVSPEDSTHEARRGKQKAPHLLGDLSCLSLSYVTSVPPSLFYHLRSMASPQIVFPPPSWLNQDIIVYHGTVDTFATAIVSGPILVSLGKPCTDFGPGFYTTTLKRQAQMWAAQISASRRGTNPAVIEITIKRLSLASLETVAFVRGDFDADDYWSLIHHCRKGAFHHGRPAPPSVLRCGLRPRGRILEPENDWSDADQISFYTASAERLLNSSARRRII